jgi:hypothetical protein
MTDLKRIAQARGLTVRMASVLPVALLRAAPVQRPCAAGVVVAEQVGADRLRQGGIVDQQRDIFARPLAGAFPAGADLRAVVIAEMNAIVGRVLGIGRLGRNDGDFLVIVKGGCVR